MLSSTSGRCFIVLGIGALLGLLAGCGGARSTSAYVPSDDASQQALTAALTAWKSGKPMGQVENTPPVQVVDNQWQAGKKLRDFQVLGKVEGEGHKQFRVKLTMDGAAPQEVVYVILGRDPLWVYREEDYKKTTGMQ